MYLGEGRAARRRGYILREKFSCTLVRRVKFQLRNSPSTRIERSGLKRSQVCVRKIIDCLDAVEKQSRSYKRNLWNQTMTPRATSGQNINQTKAAVQLLFIPTNMPTITGEMEEIELFMKDIIPEARPMDGRGI